MADVGAVCGYLSVLGIIGRSEEQPFVPVTTRNADQHIGGPVMCRGQAAGAAPHWEAAALLTQRNGDE
jgi:hypothetical protein